MIRSKMQALSCPQHFFRRSRAGNSKVKGRMAGIWTHPRLYALVTCKFDNDTINTKGVITCLSTAFSPFILVYGKRFYTQGHVILKQYSDLAQNQTHPGFYACPGQRRYRVHSIFSTINAQGHGKIKRIVQFGPKSNSSKMIWICKADKVCNCLPLIID